MSNSGGGSSKLLYSVGLGAGVTLLSGASYWYYKYWKKDVMPSKWRRIGTLQQMFIFPVKSCAPLELAPEAEVAAEILGLRFDSCRDRAFMLIDAGNGFVTARTYPKMVLITSKLVEPTKLVISAPNMEPLELNFAKLAEEAPGQDVHTAVFGAKLDAMLCGEKYDRWFSKYILNKDAGLRLVYFPYPKPMKPIFADFAKEPSITPMDTGTFNDATSYMLMNLSSIADLNTRLTKPVEPLQFRGNFYLKPDSNEPYAEDHWGWIKIGENAIFRNVAGCQRCIFPNINTTNGERDPDGEPLKTLKSYRILGKNKSPSFGIHMGVRQEGVVKLNDIIYVGEK